MRKRGSGSFPRCPGWKKGTKRQTQITLTHFLPVRSYERLQRVRDDVFSARCRLTGELVSVRQFDVDSPTLLHLLCSRAAGLPHAAAVRDVAIPSTPADDWAGLSVPGSSAVFLYLITDYHPCDQEPLAGSLSLGEVESPTAALRTAPFAFG